MSCHICRGPISAIREFAPKSREEIQLVTCQECHCEQLEPQPSDALLGLEYANYYDRRSRGIERAKLAYFMELIRNTKESYAGKRILEVGAGEGDCALAMESLFPAAKYTAVEANPECKDFYKNLSCELVPQTIEDWLKSNESEAYDYIFMFDLIEHLRDPLATLKTVVTKKLSPGGKIIATFPSVDTGSRKWMGRLWPQYKLEHLFYFSDRSIDSMKSQLGVDAEIMHLRKKLPIRYLVNVGSHFGPSGMQRLTSLVGGILPELLLSRSITLPLGEKMAIFTKR